MENNFPGSTFIDLATMYRDCYSVGKGFISSEIFITVANESNFFVSILK